MIQELVETLSRADDRHHDRHHRHEPRDERHGQGGMRLARAYVPMQELNEVFDPESALRHGTAFPELSMPYKRRGQ